MTIDWSASIRIHESGRRWYFTGFKLLNIGDIELIEAEPTDYTPVIIGILLGFIAIIILKFIRRKKDEPHLYELQEYLDYIKKHKRVTQKELRKHFPLSEAKISLIITELEAKGYVQKIKKGRGNVILFKQAWNASQHTWKAFAFSCHLF